MSERNWQLYIRDMLRFAEKVAAYSADLDQERFVEDELRFDAILRNLELIGEAATRVPVAVRENHAAIPWRQVIATRNRLIHGYLGIDNDTIWSIVNDDVPHLIAELKKLAR